MQFRILGPVEAVRDGVRLPLAGSKIHTVLAELLLARGRVVPVERLSRSLWGWEPPATMNAQIYTYIFRLRKQLADDVTIVRRQPGYSLDPGRSSVDAVEYERLDGLGRQALAERRYEEASRLLHEALDLWRGTPLANTTEFLSEAEAPQWLESRAATLDCRIEADLAVGSHEGLVSELTRMVAANPLRERLRAQLMTSLYLTSRQADALATYREGVVVLREELGIDPGPALREVHRQVLDGVLAGPPVSEPTPFLRTAPTRDRRHPLPAMLPADMTDFIGRGEPLAAVLSELGAADSSSSEPQRHHRILLTGIPGIGKSAIAVRAAHLLRGDFPDGQLYADLADPDGRAKDPVEILRVFLRALGAPEHAIPASSDERVQMYRALLDRRSMLVLLDNVVSDAQARPLLPSGAHCRTILTSCAPLTAVEGVRLVQVGPLSTVEGVELLAALAGRGRVAGEPEAAEALVRLCDHWPLALRVCGSRLAGRPDWQVARLLARLGSQEYRLSELRHGGLDVRRRLQLSYRALPPDAQHALRQLALLPEGEFTEAEAVRVLRMDGHRVEEMLETLADAQLLTVARLRSEFQLGYRIAPLTRLYAQEQLVGRRVRSTLRDELVSM